MKLMFKAVMIAFVVLAVVSCKKDKPAPGGKEGAQQVKVGPPFNLEVKKEKVTEEENFPVTVEISPTQDLEAMEITWELPYGVSMIDGDMETEIPSEELLKGDLSTVRVEFGLGDEEPVKITVTVRAKWQGEWYGSSKVVNIKPPKTAGRVGGDFDETWEEVDDEYAEEEMEEGEVLGD